MHTTQKQPSQGLTSTAIAIAIPTTTATLSSLCDFHSRHLSRRSTPLPPPGQADSQSVASLASELTSDACRERSNSSSAPSESSLALLHLTLVQLRTISKEARYRGQWFLIGVRYMTKISQLSHPFPNLFVISWLISSNSGAHVYQIKAW